MTQHRLDAETVIRAHQRERAELLLVQEAVRQLRAEGMTPQSENWSTQYDERIARLRAGRSE